MAILDLHPQPPFDAGKRGQQVIERLLGGHPEFPAPRGYLDPAVRIAVIALGAISAVQQDEIAVVGQLHVWA